jgi:predicted MPP superfamily phosphohydrolase
MITFFIFVALILLIDYYLFQAVITVSKDWSQTAQRITRIGFWIPTILSIAALIWWNFANPDTLGPQVRNWVRVVVMGIYISKFFGILIVFIDDLQRGGRWVAGLFSPATESSSGNVIPRSEFLAQTALIATAVPFTALAFGIISGAHDYRVRRKTVYLPNLPKSFDGMKIGQLSDIHSGSFFNKVAVKGGVEDFLKEKPDVIFFTGDLVNNEASEVKDYLNIFDKLKGPLGTYSITGNHDYGDYKSWSSQRDKQENFKNLVQAHKQMGFDILMNEHRYLEQGGEKIAIIGIENWGGGGFAKYGKLDQAYTGIEDANVKLLLSHDPSHWDAQVRKSYKDIDMMFAGHTHGFQFGVEIGDFKWSPSQYAYKQWAGLYNEDNQYLYVNRGFGYIGYPGRIGIPPELTIIELKRA